MSRTRQPVNLQPQSTTETSRESSTLRLTGTLRLRAEDTPDTTAEPSPSRRIRWSEDVVDNEGMGKKSSKVCCIYHKARPVGESSSEESSSSSSDSDSESDTDRRNHMARHAHARGRRPSGENQADQSADAAATEGCCSDNHHPQKIKRRRRKPSPNAYEKMPKPSKSQPRGS
ncbi:Type 1 phosphatases regulator ypi1 [Penicillium subrubescens]|uniref:Type 1 phosphatases regulator n=1 Tax=Penicillium subrubescens TaxID=1316194 RepID=A0A1Q5TMQ6_9EURO|nr:Type 1 phosphatases regulator ypi1 [Penicillium subrubescens]KAJ5880551.1 Type 1 phosphatases regulator ypi1 [Penicillium subrubescens]OKP01472.1 Type 1 phosphatases regulator ypi1 [Penicillium subrubescens]